VEVVIGDAMDYLALEHFDAGYSALRALFDDPTELDADYQALRQTLNMPAIEYCTRTLITAESDCVTAGDRGLGRATTAVPRLGARCRRQIGALDVAAKRQLYFLIQDIILRGYLTDALLVKSPHPVSITDTQTIFQKWIPIIYSSSGSLSDSMANAVSTVADTAFSSLDVFMVQYGMPSLFDDSARMGEIVWPYAKSGANLRAVECGLYGS